MAGEEITRPVLLAEATVAEVAQALSEVGDAGRLGRARQLYTALWEQLDQARAAASAAGYPVESFDALRKTVPGAGDLFAAQQTPLARRDGLSFVAHEVIGLSAISTTELELGGLVVARQCAQALKQAAPDLPWRQESRRLAELENTNVRSGRWVAYLILLVVASAIIYVVMFISKHT